MRILEKANFQKLKEDYFPVTECGQENNLYLDCGEDCITINLLAIIEIFT